MNTTEWKASGHFLKFEKYDIFFKDNKNVDKPTLVLLHGYPTASWDYWKMWKLLSTQFRLISFDFLGFGYSSKPTDIQYSIHLQTDISESIIKHLDIEQYHVIAHDYAVSVAQELLARKIESHSEKLLSICFLNGGVFAEMHRPLLIQKLMLSPMGAMMSYFIGKKSLEKSFKKIFGPETQATESELNEFWNLIQFNQGRKTIPLLITYMLDRKKHRDRWCLPLIDPIIPIRFINGNLDPVSGKHVIERYLELYPQADVINLPTIGHYPNMEAAEDVVKYYLEFFNKEY
jgi:pimeloyl-ACP methyl ester carboxylesterase